MLRVLIFVKLNSISEFIVVFLQNSSVSISIVNVNGIFVSSLDRSALGTRLSQPDKSLESGICYNYTYK